MKIVSIFKTVKNPQSELNAAERSLRNTVHRKQKIIMPVKVTYYSFSYIVGMV